MALDSATRALLDTMAAAGGKPLHECTPAEARAFGQALAELTGPAPAMREVLDCEATGPAGPVPLRVLTPPQGARTRRPAMDPTIPVPGPCAVSISRYPSDSVEVASVSPSRPANCLSGRIAIR